MATSATPAPPGASGDARPTWLSRAITSTPVVLTVLATVLAGLSSRELTLAQYYRSLATQQQSKADDQWNFFQAKRIRGTVVEMAVQPRDALSGERVDAARLEAAAGRLVDDCRRAQQEADKLRQALNANPQELGTADGSVRGAAERLAAAVREQAARAEEVRRKLGEALEKPEFREALTYLAGGKLPEAEKRPLTDEDLRKAVAALDARQTERDVEAAVKKVRPEVLQQAIEDAEANGRDFDARAKPAGAALKQLDRLLAQDAGLVRPFLTATRELQEALADLPDGTPKGLDDVRAAAAALDRTAAGLRLRAEELAGDVRAAERDYTARRYEAEARFNQDVALLDEVVVRKEGQVSENHRRRSVHFFYAMLGAQAGVTVGTLALAVRYRSLLWSLATIAGVSALLFASYVYMGL